MGPLLTPETFEFFARYLLAGFVFLAVRARFVSGERPNPSEFLIEAVIVSLVNQVAFLAAFGWIDAGGSPGAPRSATGRFLLLLEVLALPAALGALVGWLAGHPAVPTGLRRLLLPITRPVVQSFDHAFAQVEEPCFLLISFADGREVRGYFGPRSLAGPDLEHGGIFLERLYVMSEDGEWVEARPPRSAWIALTDVRSIEFLDGEDV